MEPDEIQPEEDIEFDVGEPDDDIDVEVDVSTGEGDDESNEAADTDAKPKAEEQKPEDAPKPKFRANSRITELAKRAAEAEERAAAAERALREREELLNSERASNFKALEAGLTAELAAAKRKLADAHALGDGAQIADATEEVGRLAADLSAIKAYPTQQRQTEQPKQTEQQPQPQQAQIAPRTKAWIESNPWFTPDSAEYDPELAVDAQAFAKKLEIRLQRAGKAAEIGSDDYFRQIDEYMAKTYPDVFEYEDATPAKPKVPPMDAKPKTAPISRQADAVQQQPKSKTVRLTEAQKRMAERMSPELPPQKAWAEYARWM